MVKLLASKITSILAQRDPNFDGKVELNQNIKIRNIEKFTLEGSKKDSLKVDYTYDIDYKKLGKISIQGILYLDFDQKVIKDILKDWKENKKNEEQQLEIINIIIQKASIKAIELEDQLGLPIHFRLPFLKGKK
jgi:ribosomal protein L13